MNPKLGHLRAEMSMHDAEHVCRLLLVPDMRLMDCVMNSFLSYLELVREKVMYSYSFFSVALWEFGLLELSILEELVYDNRLLRIISSNSSCNSWS